MHPAFVDLEETDVALGEARLFADLDVVRPSCRVGDDAVVQHHTHRAIHTGEGTLEPGFQAHDRLFPADRLLFGNDHRASVDRSEGFRHHLAKLGKGRFSSMERVGRASVELLRYRREPRQPARLEHLDDREVLAAHPLEDLADRAERPESTSDVAFEIPELELLRLRIEAERTSQVIIPVYPRQLLQSGAEELLFDRRVPLDRVEDPDRALGLDEPIGELANRSPVDL